jgi:glucoamylase
MKNLKFVVFALFAGLTVSVQSQISEAIPQKRLAPRGAFQTVPQSVAPSHSVVVQGPRPQQMVSPPILDRRSQDDQAFFDQKVKSEKLMLLNINAPTVKVGVIVASLSQSQPNYFFHWVRDAAIVFMQFQNIYLNDPTVGNSRGQMQTWMLAHSELNLQLQSLAAGAVGNLGEPKFNVDGSVFTGPWGRPQNDGPAIRAISFMNFFNIISRENGSNKNDILKNLYDPNFAHPSLIKTDLEYIAHHWSEPSFDLWEEAFGNHFFTLVVTRKALRLGAILAQNLGDTGAAAFYQQESLKVVQALQAFWNPNGNYILATLNPQGPTSKPLNLDTSVLLAALYGDLGDGFIAPSDDHVLATLEILKEVFQKQFPINQNPNFGIALGRYPGDTYDGVKTGSVGNPWFITTQTAAEIYYRTCLQALQTKQILITALNLRFYNQLMSQQVKFVPGQILTVKDLLYLKVANQLFIEGDRHLELTIIHRGPDGSLSEQFNGANGFMQGATNLTWSHASFLSANAWRDYVRAFRPN